MTWAERGSLLAGLILLWAGQATAQAPDTALVQGGIYQRPFIVSAGRTAVGGYLEAHGAFSRTDGVPEGPSFEVRRFNIFLYSAVGRRLRFTSELEFEHGTEEIALETALLDFVVTPSLVLRIGVLLPPVGAFNVSHDGPRYEFVERPLVSTEIIPATLSEVGIGAHGRLAPSPGLSLSYDAYLTNGLGPAVVLNETGRTSFPGGKGESLFAGDQNGSPAFSGRIAARGRGLGEVGFSHYRAIYNTWRLEGERIDEPRWLSLSAVDASTALGPLDLRGELALGLVDLPDDLAEVLGDRQWGFHLDAVLPIWRPRIRGLADPAVLAGVRLERVDFNAGSFGDSGQKRFDERNAVTVALSFRPVPGTVFRLNYRHQSFRDLLGNPAERTGGFQLGVATYF